jgi:hypothetical protein
MNPHRRQRLRKLLRWGGVTYLMLWFVTALWGTSTVDRAFDTEFAMGEGLSQDKPEPVIRVAYTKGMQKHDGIWSVPPDKNWRARSRGFAVAPFIVLDAAAWIDGGLSGFSGYRINLWFFGATSWFPLRVFWVA